MSSKDDLKAAFTGESRQTGHTWPFQKKPMKKGIIR